MTLLSKHKPVIMLLFFISLGALLRFYDLNWGSPYYFHPDERNIASSISQLTFANNLHPNFFAYGSLPIYVIFFLGLPLRLFTSCMREFATCSVRFEDALLIGRTISASLSLLLLPLIYLVGRKLHSETAGVIAMSLAATSTGLLQFAHFATFEMWSTFLSVLLFFLSVKLLRTESKRIVAMTGLTLGALLSVKVSNLILLPIPFLALFANALLVHAKKQSLMKRITKIILVTIGIGTFAVPVFLLSNPFVFLDQKAFLGSMNYESGVALGTIPVFYIGEFYNTTPIIFHLLHVFPFLLNPLNTLLAIVGFFVVLYCSIKKKDIQLSLLPLATLLLLLPQSFFFVKWVRYMVPTIPFFLLGIAILLAMLMQSRNHRVAIIGVWLTFITIFVNMVFGISYTITTFVEQDTRVAASEYAKNTIPVVAPIVADIYDMGIVPFNPYFSSIDLFHFYELDTEGVPTLSEVPEMLASHEYYILPSQRILATRLGNPEKFPEGYSFYQALIHGDGFTKIYESPCSIFCQITYLGDQIHRFEGTANAFDRPPILIYKIHHEE